MRDEKCAALDCNEDHEYLPTLIVHAKGHRPDEYEPARIPINYGFCRYHADNLEAYNIITETDWTKICLEFYRSHRVQPDKENVGIEWSKIGEVETTVEVPPLS